jgi:hypothetical protein
LYYVYLITISVSTTWFGYFSFNVGKLQWKMLQGKDQWILDYFMELLMVTLGLVGEAISSIGEALV